MNEDWYRVKEVDHPAPRLEELVALLREFGEHQSGSFEHIGRFYQLRFTHLEKLAASTPVPLFTAGVNPRMVEVAGRVADGFVGHPLASVDYLQQVALPSVEAGASRVGRRVNDIQRLTQVIAAIDEDLSAARRRAALQVGFYSTVKTYEVIFETHGFEEERRAIRAAFFDDDMEAMIKATTDEMLDVMCVYGTTNQVIDALHRYEGVADEVILYPPHFGVAPKQLQVHQAEMISFIRDAKRARLSPTSREDR
jgi:alkanesulfonate monooxygenase SsuD/methylene tetrahydromethanopterin reductase-like flavin-dependent oxidoreductase (luciferase family)